MANHFLAIDPVLLMDEDQLEVLDKLNTAGEAQDFIQKELNNEFDFGQVFQSTNNEHDLHVHEFMLANETGQRKMHKMGVMKTPSDLVAFVTVDDEWMKEHEGIVNKGVHFKMNERVDPKELKAVNGRTEDGQTTSALRYAHYTSNILMVSENEKAISKKETPKTMEDRAKEEDTILRERSFNLDPLRFIKSQHDSVKKQSIEGAFLDGFMKGWDMTDNYKSFKERRPQPTQEQRDAGKDATNEPAKTVQIGDGLKELSARMMEQQEHQQQ